MELFAVVAFTAGPVFAGARAAAFAEAATFTFEDAFFAPDDVLLGGLVEDTRADDVLLEEVLARAVLDGDDVVADLAAEAEVEVADFALAGAALAVVDRLVDTFDRAEEEGARLVLAVADVGLLGMAHSFVGPGGDGPHGTRRGRMRT